MDQAGARLGQFDHIVEVPAVDHRKLLHISALVLIH